MEWHINCPKCGYYGLGRRILPGSDLAEKALWLLVLLPGLAYRVWRLTHARVGCSRCDWDGTQPPAPA